MRKKIVANWLGLHLPMELSAVERLSPSAQFAGMHYRKHMLRILKGESVQFKPTFDPMVDTISLQPLRDHLVTYPTSSSYPKLSASSDLPATVRWDANLTTAGTDANTSSMRPSRVSHSLMTSISGTQEVHQCMPTLILLQPPQCPGFGHRFATLLIALDIATRASMRLILADNFWRAGRSSVRATTPGATRGRQLSAASTQHGCAYSWAEQLLPVPLASSVSSACILPRRVTVDALLSQSQAHTMSKCPACLSAQVGGPVSCGRSYCFATYEGGSERAIPQLHDLYGSHISAWYHRGNRTDNETVKAHSSSRQVAKVVWHIRTGWAAGMGYLLNETAAQRIRQSIEDGFRMRRVQHTCIAQHTANKPWAQSKHSWVARLGCTVHSAANLNDIEALRMMATADVLVSTGSSFPLAAASLAPLGAQLHVFLPPKEIAAGSGMSPAQLRPLGNYRGYFRSHNTVPFDLRGVPFAEYLPKLNGMLDALDRIGHAPETVARLSFESWLDEARSAPASWIRTSASSSLHSPRTQTVQQGGG